MYIYILKLKRGEKAVFAQLCSETDCTNFRNNREHEHALKMEFLGQCDESSKHFEWSKSRKKTIDIMSGVGLAKGVIYEVFYTVSEKKSPFRVKANSNMGIVLEDIDKKHCPASFFRRKIRNKIKREFGEEALLLAFQITSIDIPLSIF